MNFALKYCANVARVRISPRTNSQKAEFEVEKKSLSCSLHLLQQSFSSTLASDVKFTRSYTCVL